MASPDLVRRALSEVLDPEYPVSLVDLGLVREVEVDGGTARVSIAYCSLGCPCIDLIEQDVEERLLRLEGIERVEVVESFEPWTRRDVSRQGLVQLRGAGVA
jgi:metal-sulfur cluster biosynthetic enzyme